MPDTAADTATTIQSVDRAVRILQLLSDEPALGVSEIARALDVHRSTAFRLLATLEAHHLVEQEAHRGLYRLGLGVLRMSASVSRRIDLVRDAQLVCDQLADELGETSNVAILEDRAAVNITQTMSRQRIAVLRQYIGQRTPLHATSTGKVLLAHAPTTLREAVLGGPLERFTDSTVVEPELLRAELSTVREQGWAAAAAEWEADTNAVAVPVLGASGAVVAALSVTAPGFRMPQADFAGIAATLAERSAELSRRLGHVRQQSAP